MNFTIFCNMLCCEGVAIANFIPTVLGTYQPDNDPEGQLQLLLEIRRENTIVRTLVWAAEQLDELNLEKLIPGCICCDDCGHNTKRLINTYLRLQICELQSPPGVYINSTGWHNQSGEYRYFFGDASTNFLEKASVSAVPPYLIAATVADYHLATAVGLSESAAVEELLQTFALHPDIYLPVWGFSLFSVMRSFLQDSGMPTACILYIIAVQGFGKTSTAEALCQLFNHANGQIADIFDAGSTIASMQSILMHARDRAVLFDDVFIGTNKAKQRERRDKASILLRFAANEIPISKKVGSRERSTNCTASLVVTGEIPMESASDVTRCIIVRIQNRLAGFSPSLDLDALRHTAATAMQGFLLWFGKQYESKKLRIQADAAKLLSPYNAIPNERVKKSLFELYWLLGSFFDYAEQIKAISANARHQLEHASEQALRYVWQNIQSELRRIENRPRSLAEVIAEDIRTKQLPAFEHAGCTCVRTGDLVAHLQQVYRRSDLSAHFVTSELRRHNLLSLDNTGKSTKKIAGHRYLCIPKSKLFD